LRLQLVRNAGLTRYARPSGVVALLLRLSADFVGLGSNLSRIFPLRRARLSRFVTF
jgi:hypothetical protein